MIHKANINDCPSIAKLAINMWQEHTLKDLEEEFYNILENGESAIFFWK